VRRQVAAKKLEIIKISANKTLVVLSDEHRLAFQALADLRNAQPQSTSPEVAAAPDDEPRKATPPRPPRPMAVS
jgi:hypothetical protein